MPLVRGKNIRVLFDEATIAKRNQSLATEIANAGYEQLLVIMILKGSFVFAADLVRALHHAGLEPYVECMSLSSYGASQQSTGTVTVLRDIEEDVSGRDVLLVDDILESGRTLKFARDLMLERGANRADCVALLDKPRKRIADLEASFTGFECPDAFVVGYGMDSAHAFRELPYVGVVDDED